MLTRRSLAFGVASATLTPAYAGDASATAFITAIYDSYKGKDAKGTPLDSEATIRRYFEPKLATLIVRDQRTSARRNEVGALDFDPFVDAQDWDISTFDIVVADAAAGKAQATVKFINLGQPMTVMLDLIQARNVWRIYEITWQRNGKTQTLTRIFVH